MLDFIQRPKQILGAEHIQWNQPDFKIVSELKRTISSATDEKPLQLFFEEHPVALVFGVLGGPHQPWVFPHPRFGDIRGLHSIPDFLICDWTSIGPMWTVVELESPRVNPTNTRGVSGKSHHAIQQVRDYRGFFQDNVPALEQGGWIGLNGECRGFVVIGRRPDSRSRENSRRLADYRREGIEIASYDRLLEKCSSIQNAINTQSRKIRELAKKRMTSKN